MMQKPSNSGCQVLDRQAIGVGALKSTATGLTMSEKSCTPACCMHGGMNGHQHMGQEPYPDLLDLCCGPILSGHTNVSIHFDDMALTVLSTTPAAPSRGTAETPVPPTSDGEASSAL
jgi:hypothetical protein